MRARRVTMAEYDEADGEEEAKMQLSLLRRSRPNGLPKLHNEA